MQFEEPGDTIQSRTENFIPSTTLSPLHVNLTYSQVPGVKVWTSGVGKEQYTAYHKPDECICASCILIKLYIFSSLLKSVVLPVTSVVQSCNKRYSHDSTMGKSLSLSGQGMLLVKV